MSARTRSHPGRPGGGPLRIGFAGTPEFAATVLRALLNDGYEVAVVYTQPDRPAGRGRKLQPSPVKLVAEAHGIEIAQPASLRSDQAVRDLEAFNLDVLVVAAYGLILPEPILAVPALGCINVHASELPRWRGAAPVERAILAGDTHTGVSIMQMDAGLDTGPVLARASCPISGDTLGSELEKTLADLGAQCLLECLADLGHLQREPQDEASATYAAKLTGADARVDWSEPAEQIQRQIRALSGRLPATCAVGGLRIKLLRADWQAARQDAPPGTIIGTDADGIHVACGRGTIILQQVQLNRGKGRPLSARDASNGYPDIFATGARLADPA